MVDGKKYTLPPDFDRLEEINYKDPSVKKWLEEERAESIRKYGKVTTEEADYMLSRRQALQKKFPNRSVEDLNRVALEELRATKK